MHKADFSVEKIRLNRGFISWKYATFTKIVLFVLCHEGLNTYAHADAKTEKNITVALFIENKGVGRKVIDHYTPEGTKKSHPRVHDLRHPRLRKPCHGLQTMDTRMGFPCPFWIVVIDSINLPRAIHLWTFIFRPIKGSFAPIQICWINKFNIVLLLFFRPWLFNKTVEFRQ